MGNLQFKVDMEKPVRLNRQVGLGFLILLALPFAVLGVFELARALQKWGQGGLKEANLDCLVGLVLVSVGFGLMLGAWLGAKRGQQLDSRRALHPDQPWLWRDDWAAGRIKCSGGQTAVFLWFFASFWSVVSIAVTAAVVPQELRKGNHDVLLALIFPLIGLGLLAAAVRTTLVWRRFGKCAFELAAVPAAPGGTLEGMIQTNTYLRPERGLRLRLVCLRRVTTGTGKGRHTSEIVLWQDEKILGPHLPEPRPARTGIPVFFKLPADQPESTAHYGDGVIWRLEAAARISGPDFHVTFDVPVFKLAESETVSASAADPTARYQMPIETFRAKTHSSIRISDGPGGREFFFPAARNPGVALGITLVTAIWSAIIWFMITKKVPVGFPIVFGLFNLLFFWASFCLWFKSSHAVINQTTMTLTSRWLFLGRKRRFEAGDVGQLVAQAGMRSGSRVYWDIKLVPRAQEDRLETARAEYAWTGRQPPMILRMNHPKGITIASGIASKLEADWLAEEMMKALGRV